MNRVFIAAIPQMHRLALLDIAETGTSPSRFDADGHELACFLRRRRGQGQSFLKGCPIRNDMIGR